LRQIAGATWKGEALLPVDLLHCRPVSQFFSAVLGRRVRRRDGN
jgi:hypothetical protein